MKRLSILMWIAVFTAFVPLLAIPVTLMKVILVASAIVMAGIAYSLIHKSKKSSGNDDKSFSAARQVPKDNTPDPKPTSTEKPKTPKVEEESEEDDESEKELTEEEIKKQFFNISSNSQKDVEKKKEVKDKKKNPVNVTDPNSDRFIAVNTYKSRTRRLRNK